MELTSKVKFPKKQHCQRRVTWYDRTRFGALTDEFQGSLLMSKVPTNKWQYIHHIGGYLCFQFRSQIYFYKVCPFGTVISAHFLVATWRSFFKGYFTGLCYLPHASFLYVDDLLMFQETTIIGLSASVIAIMCMLLRLPISWKKCELGPTIMWIGWEFHLSGRFYRFTNPQKEQTIGSH